MAIAVNLIWGAFLTFIIVLPLSIMPFEKFGLTDISYDILHSRAYDQIAAIMVIPLKKNSSAASTCPATPICGFAITSSSGSVPA